MIMIAIWMMCNPEIQKLQLSLQTRVQILFGFLRL